LFTGEASFTHEIDSVTTALNLLYVGSSVCHRTDESAIIA
jgi:hypothetical protein